MSVNGIINIQPFGVINNVAAAFRPPSIDTVAAIAGAETLTPADAVDEYVKDGGLDDIDYLVEGRGAGLEDKIAAEIACHEKDAPTAKHARLKIIRRARFYADVLKNIGVAIKAFHLDKISAKEFAGDTLKIAISEAKKRRVEAGATSRRLVWLAVNDRFGRGQNINLEQMIAILVGYYGERRLSANLPQRLAENRELLNNFLVSILLHLEGYVAIQSFMTRAEMVARNQKMNKVRGQRLKVKGERNFSSLNP